MCAGYEHNSQNREQDQKLLICWKTVIHNAILPCSFISNNFKQFQKASVGEQKTKVDATPADYVKSDEIGKVLTEYFQEARIYFLDCDVEDSGVADGSSRITGSEKIITPPNVEGY